jgi:hypothetical protein
MTLENLEAVVYTGARVDGPGTIIVPFGFFEVNGAPLRTWRMTDIEVYLSKVLRDWSGIDDFDFLSTQIDYDAGIVVARYEPQV